MTGVAVDKIITYNFTEDFIANVADYIEKNFLKKIPLYPPLSKGERGGFNKDGDLSRIAIVFGGKRPSLFLKREFSKRMKRSFFPPRFFSIDQFVNFIVSKNGGFRMPSDLESSYLIYNSAQKLSSEILHGRENFSNFLPWAKEIAGFIDELDIENISAENLKPVESLSEIGYEVPEGINKLLENIIELRNLFHTELRSRGMLSRGLMYMDAAKIIQETKLPEFDKILFCNFYYLHKTEKEILKHFLEKEKAFAFFQKDCNVWPVFDDLSKFLGHKIEPSYLPTTTDQSSVVAAGFSLRKTTQPKGCGYQLLPCHLSPKISIYKGFDNHSQAGLVQEILKSEIIEKSAAPLDKTVIILPDTNNLIPLISAISPIVENFNVSMGYPLKRSSLYNLLKFIVNAQLTRKGANYWTKDYLKVILHPLIKNLKISSNSASTRILVHKTEEILLGMNPALSKDYERKGGVNPEKTSLSGSLFLKLDDIENSSESKNILEEIHLLSFKMWEDIANFSQFCDCLEKFNDYILSKSFGHSYPLNVKILDRIYAIIDELKTAEFKNQPFNKEDIFKIFDKKIQNEIVSFAGSPLKGLQILGLFESRSLNFENVIIMDVNESVLPKTQVYSSIIPRQIMEGLGLQRLKQEEEIQRYHFMRLISGAKNVYFVYDGNPAKEKSRFLEEIIWKKQKEEKMISVFPETCAKFNPVNISAAKNTVKKSEKVIKYLAGFAYSSSSIDTYLNCPMKFYYQYVLRLKEKENLLDEVEAKDVGTFIHELLDYAFRRFLDKKPVIDGKFEKEFFDEFERRFSEKLQKRLGPEAFLVKEVMEYRLKKFIGNERSRDVQKVLSLEEKLSGGITLPSNKLIDFKYTIDRIDLLGDGTILVIDYKTGQSAKSPATLKQLERIKFNRESIKGAVHSFQLPIYYYFVQQRYNAPINAVLYNLVETKFTDFVKKDRENTDKVMEICLKCLDFIIFEITNPDIDFQNDESNKQNCKYCEFNGMC
ncbi:MAG: PD-(D/E)XK nuclease family protein [bacterium]